jgi:hypothetical protein
LQELHQLVQVLVQVLVVFVVLVVQQQEQFVQERVDHLVLVLDQVQEPEAS